MAKQVGIHQIRGKVDGRSYYRQSGVAEGLSRSINQGLSDRVKNSPEYANTRLNNAEFKRANRLATVAFHSIYPSWRSMYRRFAVALMTKRFLELVKGGTESWGRRYPKVELGGAFEDVLLHYAKNGEYQGQYGEINKTSILAEVTIGEKTFNQNVPQITQNLTREVASSMAAQGINGLDIYSRTVYVACNDDVLLAMSTPQKVSLGVSADPQWQPSEEQFDALDLASKQVIAPSPRKIVISDAPNAGVYLVHVIVPYRTIGGVSHELQELATYEIAGFPLKPQA